MRALYMVAKGNHRLVMSCSVVGRPRVWETVLGYGTVMVDFSSSGMIVFVPGVNDAEVGFRNVIYFFHMGFPESLSIRHSVIVAKETLYRRAM